jgi:biopolymer transport protein TolQ
VNVFQFLNPPPVLPLANMIFAFKTSSFFSGKLIVIILFLASILVWTIMVTKFLELRKAEAESKKFGAGYRREKHPLALFLKRQKYPDSPLFKVYEGACAALGVELEGRGQDASELFVRDPQAIYAKLNMMQINAVRNAAERSVADQALLLERNMGYLATAVNASPLLGLLGTVWGVLDSFVEMALIGMVNLAAVAPGIAAALLTTVVGLLVAIPSAIGYNILTSRIRGICVQMENFTDELMADMQRTFVQG